MTYYDTIFCFQFTMHSTQINGVSHRSIFKIFECFIFRDEYIETDAVIFFDCKCILFSLNASDNYVVDRFSTYHSYVFIQQRTKSREHKHTDTPTHLHIYADIGQNVTNQVLVLAECVQHTQLTLIR